MRPRWCAPPTGTRCSYGATASCIHVVRACLRKTLVGNRVRGHVACCRLRGTRAQKRRELDRAGEHPFYFVNTQAIVGDDGDDGDDEGTRREGILPGSPREKLAARNPSRRRTRRTDSDPPVEWLFKRNFHPPFLVPVVIVIVVVK